MKRWLEKLIERGAIALAIVAAIVVPLYWLYQLYGFWYMESQFTKPEALLHRTDYEAIRDACREMMAKHRRGELPGTVFRDDPRIPEAIRPLRPSYILIFDDEVVLEMHSGSDHYGFRVYSKGLTWEGREAGWKLIDGLWIYGVDYPSKAKKGSTSNAIKLRRQEPQATASQELTPIGSQLFRRLG